MERARWFYEKTLGLTAGAISDNGAWVELRKKSPNNWRHQLLHPALSTHKVYG